MDAPGGHPRKGREPVRIGEQAGRDLSTRDRRERGCEAADLSLDLPLKSGVVSLEGFAKASHVGCQDRVRFPRTGQELLLGVHLSSQGPLEPLLFPAESDQRLHRVALGSGKSRARDRESHLAVALCGPDPAGCAPYVGRPCRVRAYA